MKNRYVRYLQGKVITARIALPANSAVSTRKDANLAKEIIEGKNKAAREPQARRSSAGDSCDLGATVVHSNVGKR